MGFTFSFNGMNTLRDPASFPIKRGDRGSSIEDCLEMVNCFADDEGNAIRRDGYTQVLASPNTYSGWSNGRVAYFNEGPYLHLFDGTPNASTPVKIIVNNQVVHDFFGNPPFEFVEVNDIIVFSDGEQIGVLNGAVATMVPLDQHTPGTSDWTTVTALEAWVNTHHPGGWEDGANNLEVDDFSLPAFGGRCLEFFNGVLYLARDNFLYCTKAMDIEHMDIRYNVVAGFSHPVTMVQKVADGLYVGTTKGTYFLRGTGISFDEKHQASGGFTQERLDHLGVFYNTCVKAPGNLVPVAQMEKTVVLWSGANGVMAGGNGGHVVNISKGITLFPEPEANLLPATGWQANAVGYFPNLVIGHTYTFSGMYAASQGTPTCIINYNDVEQMSISGAELPVPFDLTFVAITTNPIYITGSTSVDVFSGFVLVDHSGGCAFFRDSGGIFQYVTSLSSEAWAVNTSTGAHSRYTNYDFDCFFELASRYYGGWVGRGLYELTGNTDAGALIDAYALTPSTDFGKDKLKQCTAAYAHARAENTLVLDLYVDEKLYAQDLPTISTGVAGAHRQRIKLPRGARGTNWQFKIRNLAGKPFTLLALDTDPVALTRTT